MDYHMVAYTLFIFSLQSITLNYFLLLRWPYALVA